MPLNASGPISIGGSTTGQSINLELGRDAGATSSLDENALRTLAGVPSGAISMSNFYGKSSIVLGATLQNYNAATYDIQINPVYNTYAPGTVTTRGGIRLLSTGVAEYYDMLFDSTTVRATFNWKTGDGTVGDYYAYLTSFSGDAFAVNAGIDTALALSTSRDWRLDVSCVAGGSAFKQNFFTLQIRSVSGTVLVSKTCYISVEANSDGGGGGGD